MESKQVAIIGGPSAHATIEGSDKEANLPHLVLMVGNAQAVKGSSPNPPPTLTIIVGLHDMLQDLLQVIETSVKALENLLANNTPGKYAFTTTSHITSDGHRTSPLVIIEEDSGDDKSCPKKCYVHSKSFNSISHRLYNSIVLDTVDHDHGNSLIVGSGAIGRKLFGTLSIGAISNKKGRVSFWQTTLMQHRRDERMLGSLSRTHRGNSSSLKSQKTPRERF